MDILIAVVSLLILQRKLIGRSEVMSPDFTHVKWIGGPLSSFVLYGGTKVELIMTLKFKIPLTSLFLYSGYR